MRYILTLALLTISGVVLAQVDRWQQRVDYKMEIDMNVKTNQFKGTQQLVYTNNSPDTLYKVFYHLYFNAFQPGSMMDVRSRTIEDPDRRVKDRILYLKENEIGYHKIKSFTQDNEALSYQVDGTVVTVRLVKPILPNAQTTFDMIFESQVPLQIRRNGRDNKEGIRYSMAQWFPKIAEYDQSGWQAHDYVGREFHSPWGDYDVTININSEYTVAATGLLQNAEEIGKGYADVTPKGKKASYHFIAKNVHDFVWAADPDYTHDIVHIREGLDFHFFYQPDTLSENWKQLGEYMKKAVPFIEEHCGSYPYPVYAVIQGGDGGMEYPMATLVTGHRSVKSLVGVTIHEYLHSWYQSVLATNESYLYWMDEGFNSYYDEWATSYTLDEDYESHQTLERSMKYYEYIHNMGIEEPLTTHADHFETNKAYGMAAYRKGSLVLQNLEYIMGTSTFDRAMLRYYDQWKFKHPNATDFELMMEKESDMELSWFFDYWIATTKTIDYGIKNVVEQNGKTHLQMERVGLIPMPLDIRVVLKNGEQLDYYIPLGMMRGGKPLESTTISMSTWKWVNPYYSFDIDQPIDQIESIEIDPSGRMTDMNRTNNKYPNTKGEVEIQGKPIKMGNMD